MAQRTGSSLLQEHTKLRANDVAELLEAMVDHAMMEGQPGHARHALSQLPLSGFIRNAYLLSNSGTVLYSTRVLENDAQIDFSKLDSLLRPAGQGYHFSHERDSLFEYLAVPIVKKKQCYECHTEPEETRGYLALKISMEDARTVAEDHRGMNILMTVATFIGVGGILFIVTSTIVIKPIKRLHGHLASVRSGLEQMERGGNVTFPTVPEPSGNDEIAELRRDFNRLVEGLNTAYASLSELHSVQLEQADRLATTGQMAASMAHEIKNPLAGVLGVLQIFESETKESDERKEIIAEMKLQLERVNYAVNDLLSYARPAPPVFEETALTSVIAKTVALLRRQAERQSIVIEMDLPDEGVVLRADSKQLQQVLWNVLLNSVQAMEEGGTLTVVAKAGTESVEILVKDTGKGIAPDQFDRIFEPFYTTRHRGTGLGMTITRRIVEQHGGHIKVISEVGNGTTVRILLPVLPKKTEG